MNETKMKVLALDSNNKNNNMSNTILIPNNKIKDMDARERKRSIALIESALRRGAENYFRYNGFVNVLPPHIVPITGACENVDTLFDVDYFGQNAYLTQTGQTALEMFVAQLGRVCCEIKSFRKEPNADTRHLTEFPLLELEFTYKEHENGFEELLRHIEGTIKSMMHHTLATARSALETLGANIEEHHRIIDTPFARIEYAAAITLLGKNWGDDLNHDDEQLIVAHHNSLPTFVMKYPEEIKFFNMKRDRTYTNIQNGKNQNRVLSCDLLLPYSGEAVGAAVREENHTILVKKLVESPMFAMLRERGKTLADFNEYLDEVRDHTVPHAGCGIGLYRVMQSVVQTDDIRLASTYLMNAASRLGYEEKPRKA